jgi:hypothetical protein
MQDLYYCLTMQETCVLDSKSWHGELSFQNIIHTLYTWILAKTLYNTILESQFVPHYYLSCG